MGLSSIPAAPLNEPISTTLVIGYSYDALNRLTGADYSDGAYFPYGYDPVGNRLAQTTPGGAANYAYDDANRLTNAGGTGYTWDANGNLLWDGVYSYTYSSANRLVAVSGQQSAFSFEYNGEGDRVAQTVNSMTTNYTLDLASGLTQVLADGEQTYLYGNGRIAQYRAGGADYFLGDALGSVRQLVDADGEVTLAKNYEPYGELMDSAGSGGTSYGYTGEMTDLTGLVYLRARYYAPWQGRFLSRDTWEGDYTRSLSLNKWIYVESNPANFVDPSGYIRETDKQDADSIIDDLWKIYGVLIEKDYGYVPSGAQGYGQCSSQWAEGAWRRIEELRWAKDAIELTSLKLSGGVSNNPRKFTSAMGAIRIGRTPGKFFNNQLRSFAPPGSLAKISYSVVITDYDTHDEMRLKYTVIHELGHAWDSNTGWKLSDGMKKLLKNEICIYEGIGYGQPNHYVCHYDVLAGQVEDPVGNPNKNSIPYPNDDKNLVLSRDIQGPWEDWADSFEVYVYPDYFKFLKWKLLGPIRRKYIDDAIKAIP